jgi:hypothetical protein
MSKEEEERGLKCQLLVEIAHASTGRNISSVSLPHVMVRSRTVLLSTFRMRGFILSIIDFKEKRWSLTVFK